jgi:bifunctional DNA-binding transcriptional regulator/antitoxin component of YhaV-PrlF toxin-antitoxin module
MRKKIHNEGQIVLPVNLRKRFNLHVDTYLVALVAWKRNRKIYNLDKGLDKITGLRIGLS